MVIIFYKNHLEFQNYEFPVASVWQSPHLKAENIREIHLNHRAPPEIITQQGEVLFVSATQRPYLRLFAQINQIPDVDILDVWSLLLEPYLDTEFSEEYQQRTHQLLNKSGFSPDEINAIRERVGSNVLNYNTLLWEWVHLGQYDLFHAFDLSNKANGETQEFYAWANQIALRGHSLDIQARSTIELAQDKIKQLIGNLAHFTSVEVSPEIKQEIEQTLISAYTDSQRHYHNLEHILAVLELCEANIFEPDQRLLLNLTAWFHDVIYDPLAADNEKQSALFMAKILAPLKLPADLITQAQSLILATQDHLLAPDTLTQVLVDADLAILAAHPDDYDRYAEAVRQEYAQVPDELFYKGRLQFLEKIQAHIQSSGHLYHHLKPIHEQLASENIQREIDLIRRHV